MNRHQHDDSGRVCTLRAYNTWVVTESPASRGMVGLTCYRLDHPRAVSE